VGNKIFGWPDMTRALLYKSKKPVVSTGKAQIANLSQRGGHSNHFHISW
jgi:hypothetical protein